MTRLYRAWNTPFVTQPCALGDATDDLVRPTYEDTPPEFRRVYRVEGKPWLSMKRCLHCGDEYPPDGGYGEPGRDYCTEWCEIHAERRSNA